VRLLVAGTPEAALPSLEALAVSRHEILGVLTRPDARAGRGRRPVRSAVAGWADERGLPVLQPRRLSDPEALDRLVGLAPDCCPVIAYGALVPPGALQLPRHGWVNLHFSLLPAWRGAAPVQRALIAGDQVTGASTFRLEAGLDTGPVYGTVTEQVRLDDTAGTLLQRLAGAGAELLVATLDGIEDATLEPVPQPAEGISLAPKLDVENARVDWSLPAHVVDRLIRGCTPAPGGWTTWRGERLKVLPPRRGSGGGEVLEPGQVLLRRDGVLVGTAGEPLLLLQVQPQGRRVMPAADWARGVRPQPGERLG
jgi:methionyl-tRNA formyltransferase